MQGLHWGREAVEMEKVGHMGEIKKKNLVCVRGCETFPQETIPK